MVANNLHVDASAWIEINAEAILYNLKTIKEHLKPETKILAVVKANAYGHGDLEVAKILSEAGVYGFGVTNITEGISLRQGGIDEPIILFAPLLPEQINTSIEFNLTPSISSITQLKELQTQAQEYNRDVKIHIKLETGMGRTGLWKSDLPQFIEILKKCPNVKLEGAYSHLAKAGTDKTFSQKQFAIFNEAIDIFKANGIDIPIKHIVNSAGLINYPNMHLDMVRVGTLLFGQIPHGIKINNIIDPWKAKAKVIDLRNVPANQPIGYGGEYITKGERKIGLVPIGFAEGFNVTPRIKAKNLLDLVKIIAKEILAYMGRGPQAIEVKYMNKSYPIVGRVGMQLSMVDFTDSNIKIGDIVEFPLRRLTAPASMPRIYVHEAVEKKQKEKGVM